MPKFDRPLERITERHGAVTVGWVGRGVLYARYEGVLSAELGTRYAARLEGFLGDAAMLELFTDASALQSYDLLGRSAVIQMMMAHRSQFASLVTLTWAGGAGPLARNFAAALGTPVEYLTDAEAFENRLLGHAPFAKRKLGQAEHASSSSRSSPRPARG